MKSFFASKWFYAAAGSILAVGALAASLFFTPAVVQAASGGPGNQPVQQATPQVKGARRDTVLELAYRREQARLKVQANRLERAGKGGDRLETLIAKAKSNGKDVSGLESALNAFRDQLINAQADHDQAAAVLSSHAGFDANGKVTDAAAAKQTLESGHKGLADAGTVLQKAAADLHSAVRAWREANPPVKKTPQS